MSDRYNVTLADMKMLAAKGFATVDKIIPVYVQEYSKEHDYTTDTDAVEYYIHTGGIGKWSFDSHSNDGVAKDDMLFTGPRVGKPDLDVIFLTNNIEPICG